MLAGLGCVIYRHRAKIKKWISDPNYGRDWKPNRKTQLKRDIEDANAELDWLEKHPADEDE